MNIYANASTQWTSWYETWETWGAANVRETGSRMKRKVRDARHTKRDVRQTSENGELLANTNGHERREAVWKGKVRGTSSDNKTERQYQHTCKRYTRFSYAIWTKDLRNRTTLVTTFHSQSNPTIRSGSLSSRGTFSIIVDIATLIAKASERTQIWMSAGRRKGSRFPYLSTGTTFSRREGNDDSRNDLSDKVSVKKHRFN